MKQLGIYFVTTRTDEPVFKLRADNAPRLVQVCTVVELTARIKLFKVGH